MLDAHILTNLIGGKSDKFDKSNHFQDRRGGFVRHYLHVCHLCLQNLEGYIKVDLILNCFENSVPDIKVGCDFSVYFLSGEESEAERKRYLHERFPHFMLFHIFSRMQMSFTIDLIDCDMVFSQVRKAISLFFCIPTL